MLSKIKTLQNEISNLQNTVFEKQKEVMLLKREYLTPFNHLVNSKMAVLKVLDLQHQGIYTHMEYTHVYDSVIRGDEGQPVLYNTLDKSRCDVTLDTNITVRGFYV